MCEKNLCEGVPAELSRDSLSANRSSDNTVVCRQSRIRNHCTSHARPQIGSFVIAFGGGMGFGIDIKGIVGAGLHTTLATDTASLVKINDSVRAYEEGRDRTNFDARRIRAMIASHDGE